MADKLPAASLGKTTLLLCLKFAVLAPICLFAWLWLLPMYTWLLGQATGAVLKLMLRVPIETVVVTRGGFLNTGTALAYALSDGRQPTMHDIGKLVTNVAPFIALVLATSGLGLWRRLKVLILGFVIIFLSHGLTIVLFFLSTGSRLALPNTVGFVAVTLPFLLWIVLAYWDKLVVYFNDEAEQDPADTADP